MIPTFGILSYVINSIAGGQFILMDSKAGAVAGIVFADAWMWSPFVMLLVLAGLVSVPKYLYEAAAIDRVSAWRRFWTITFPYIRGLLMLALLFRTIEAFKLADLVILLTKGGNDTMTISYHLIRIANEQNKTSEGAAISYIMLFMVIVLTNLYLYLANRRDQGSLSHGSTDLYLGAARLSQGRRRRARRAGAARSSWPSSASSTSCRSCSSSSPPSSRRTMALSVPPTLSPTSLFGLIPDQFVFTPTLENFASVFSRVMTAGGAPEVHRLRPLTSSTRSFIASASRPARPGHRHAGRLMASRAIRSRATTPTSSSS